jgi:hypothetical protein
MHRILSLPPETLDSREHPPGHRPVHRRDPAVELPGVDDRREARRDLPVPRGLLLPAALGLGAVWGQSCSGVIQNADQLIPGAAQVELSCHGPSTLYTIGAAILMAVLVVVPISTAVVLARRMRARTALTLPAEGLV